MYHEHRGLAAKPQKGWQLHFIIKVEHETEENI